MTACSTRRAPPPAYQVYAANRIADRNEKAMSLQERGLRYCIELECWCNGSVPANPRELARVLSLTQPEVESALTARVMRYFEEREQPDGPALICPSLDDYRQKLDEIYQNRADAGRRNIEAINKRRRSLTSNSSDNSSDDSTGAKYSKDQTSQKQSLESGAIPEEHREFVAELEGEPEFMVEKNGAAKTRNQGLNT